MNRISNRKKQDRVAAVLFSLTAVYMLCFIFRGIGTIDESFYLTIPHRLCLGDALIKDEWHISQFSSFFQYAPFAVFYHLTGSTRGVVLFFRVLYILCHTGVSVFLYTKLRRYSAASVIAVFLFYRYTVMYTMALDYYTLSLWSCIIFLCLYFLCPKKSIPILILCGVFFSFAVLAEPLLAIVYFVWLLYTLIRALLMKRNSRFSPEEIKFCLKNAGFITLGILIVALVFLAWLLRKMSLSEMISAIPNLFTDSEYSIPFFSPGEENLFDFTALVQALTGMGKGSVILYALTVLAVLIDKKRVSHAGSYAAFSAAVCLFNQVMLCVQARDGDIRYAFFRNIPLFFFTSICMLLLENKDKSLMKIWAFGVIFSFVVDVSSANSYIVMLGSLISNVSGVMFVGSLVEQLRKTDKKKKQSGSKKSIYRKRLCAYFLAAFLLLTSAAEIYQAVYENNNLLYEDYLSGTQGAGTQVKLERGPFSGLYTSETVSRKYNAILNDLDRIRQDGGGKLYIPTSMSWLYLYADMPYSAYSTWFVESDYRTRQLDYYEKNPYKLPEYIYVPQVSVFGMKDKDYSDMVEYYSTLYDCVRIDAEAGVILKVK